MTTPRRSPYAAVGLASLLALSACTAAEADAFFARLVLLIFGAIGSLASLVGTALAVVLIVRRDRRALVHWVPIAFAVPFAIAAIWVLEDTAAVFARAHGRHDGGLLVLAGTPLIWLAVSVVGLLLAPPPLAPPPLAPPPLAPPIAGQPPAEPPLPPLPMSPLFPWKVLAVVVPTVLVLAAFTAHIVVVLRLF